jgi:hypothetical protein
MTEDPAPEQLKEILEEHLRWAQGIRLKLKQLMR